MGYELLNVDIGTLSTDKGDYFSNLMREPSL